MIRFRIGTALLGVCMFAPAAWAHHSHAMYDTSKNVALTGTIVSFHWMNPHVWVYLETRDASGTPVQWVLEGGSPATLSRRGWAANSFKPGDNVTADVHPLRDGNGGGLLGTLKLDGKEFDGN